MDPARVTEITLQPLRRMPLDAAILFSDIMVPLAAVGVPVRIEPGRGPVLDEPFRTARDVARLRALEPVADVPHVLEAIRLVRREVDVPLLGFAGAPFTLASYLVEGGPSRDHARTKALMLGEPATWRLPSDEAPGTGGVLGGSSLPGSAIPRGVTARLGVSRLGAGARGGRVRVPCASSAAPEIGRG